MKHRGGCLPTPQQELLIRIVLGPAATRHDRWQQWEAGTDLDQLDPGSLRLLPLLYHRLKEAGIPDNRLTRYRGIYRHYWYRNRLYIQQLDHVLTLLNRQEIQPLMLKGLPLALKIYPDPALRPMLDLDLFVQPVSLHAAVKKLTDAGWESDRTPPNQPDGRWLAAVKAIHLNHPDGIAIDLHGTVLSEIADPSFDDAMLALAQPVTIRNGVALVPEPTDMLFHTIAHGYRWNSLPPFRWIVDAVELMRHHRNELDMDRLFRTAYTFRLDKRIRSGLSIAHSYLEDNPGKVSHTHWTPLWEKMEHHLKTRQHVIPARTGYLIFDTWRWIRRHQGIQRMTEMFRFLKLRWDVGRSRELPGEMVRRIHRRLSRKSGTPTP